MDSQMKLSLFVLLTLEGLFSTQQTVTSSTNDITSYLGKWIAEMFEKDLSTTTEEDLSTTNAEYFSTSTEENLATTTINSLMRSAFASAEHHRVEEFEYSLTDKLEPFQSKFYFHDINFYTHPEDARLTGPFHLSSWSSTNLAIATNFLRITLEGELRAEKDTPYTSYFTTLHFHDFVLNATRISNDSDAPKFSYDLSYRKYNAKHHEYFVNIKWTTGNLSDDQESSLTERIEPLLPILLREHINRNPKFSAAMQEIIQLYPCLFFNAEQVYYQIPNIPFFGFNLREVVVRGFSNLERFDTFDEDDDDHRVFSRTLLFRNLRGGLTLDYESKDETSLSLNYSIDYLSISSMRSGYVHVEAASYCVNRTNNGEPLSYRQSTNIMKKIESGLASALFPDKRAWKVIDMESKIRRMNMADEELKTIRRLYSDWIPFNYN